MKKVRFALGVVGAAPVALGLVAPAAGAAVHAAKPTLKKVALPPGRTAPDTGCTAHTPGHVNTGHNGHVSYWYTRSGPSTCIGTIEGHDFGGLHTQGLRVRFYDAHNKLFVNSSAKSYNVESQSDVFVPFGPHKFYPHAIGQVCATFFSGAQSWKHCSPLN